MGTALTAFIDSSSTRGGPALVDDAVIPAFFLLLLMCLPSPSSEELKPESESEAGGGVAARLRNVGLDLVVRFLKAICRISAATEGSMVGDVSVKVKSIFDMTYEVQLESRNSGVDY